MADATITPVTAFTSLQVYDVDFGTGGVAIINHSFRSDHLFISVLPKGTLESDGGKGLPAVQFVDTNTVKLLQDSMVGGVFRVWITVIWQAN